MNPHSAFFANLEGTKLFPSSINSSQREGMIRLLDVWGQWYDERFKLPILAAALIEIYHETGGRMQPVIETFASTPQRAAQILESAFRAGKLPWVKAPYWNPDKNGQIWVGRGDIQMTHPAMYAKLRKVLAETYGVDVPLDKDPGLALQPVTSAVIAFEGMTKGLFRKKKLDDYLVGGEMDYVGARDVVNGDGEDSRIAEKMRTGGKLFEAALVAAGYEDGVPVSAERQIKGTANTETQGVIGSSRVSEIQQRLHEHGFGDIVGKIDGKYGPKTAKAIEAFEASRNIKLDHVDAATWQALQQPAAGEKTQ